MKKLIILLIGFFTSKAYCQNEFAATAFYTDLKNICTDAQAGFINYRGDKRISEFEELAVEYRVKLLLPLADSGKIVIPVNANPYVIYYFEPDKVRLKVDQRAVNLREAMLTVFGKPLFARTETSMVNNHPFSDTWYFTDDKETRSAAAAFRMTIYYNNDRYYLSFEIRGKKQ